MTQPTTGYTDDEIQATVQQLVLSSITTPIDTLGVRRTDLSFNQFQQTAAGLFVLYPNAPFYCLWLAVQRIRDQVTAEAALIQQLLAAIQQTNQKVLPVSDVSTLFGAQAALQNLAAAAAQRTSSIGQVSTAPAYQQFSQNVSSFLSGPGQSVKQNGQIVMTPQQAKAAIPGLMGQLQQAHQQLTAAVLLIVQGMQNYAAINLPAIVSQSVLSSAAALIGSSAQLLAGMTPTQRLTEVRQVVLNLIASKAAVDTLGTINQASDYYTLTGQGMPYSDAQHLATSAVAIGDRTGAMGIVVGETDLLLVILDGAAAVPITLPPSILAELDGQNGGTTDGTDYGFIISDGTTPGTNFPANNVFKVTTNTSGTIFNHVSYLTTSIAGGAPLYSTLQTADQIVSDINSSVSPPWPPGVTAQAYFAPLKYSGSLTVTGAGPYTWTVPMAGPLPMANLFALGVTVGDLVDYGGTMFNVTAVDPAGTYLQTNTGTEPSGVVAVTVGAPNRRVKVVCTDPYDLLHSVNIKVYGDDATSLACLQTLGFLSGMNQSCSPTTPDVVANYINKTLKAPQAGVYVSELYSGSAHGSQTDGTAVTLTTAETFGAQAPGSPTTTLHYTVSGLAVAGQVSTGDTMALRGGPNAGAAYTVSTINGSSATAHQLAVGDVVVAVGSVVVLSGIRVDVEFGPTCSIQPYSILTVPTPDPNQGQYVVMSAGATPIDLVLRTSLTQPTNGPSASTFQVSLGERSLTLASQDKTTASAVQVAGNAASLFFGDVTQEGMSGKALGISFLGTTLVYTVGAIPAGTVSVGSTLVTTNTSSGASACYLVKSVNGNATVQGHVLAANDVIVAAGNVGGPVDASVVFVTSTTQLGTTPWFRLPAAPSGLTAGDLMEVYGSQYNSPDVTYAIEQVVGTIIRLSPDIPDQQTWTFTPQPVPFARLRVGIVNDYTAVQQLMQAWLTNAVNQPLYFTNLNGLINPLLVSDNPTATQVGTATAAVNQLWAFLQGMEATELNQPPTQAVDTILASYTVQPVPVIDKLITSYSNQGADRAVDVLLSGDFVTFFGLTMDGASYSGAVQEAVRAVAQNDLPVSKHNRPEQQNGTIQSTAVTADPEYMPNIAAETTGDTIPTPPTPYGKPAQYGQLP